MHAPASQREVTPVGRINLSQLVTRQPKLRFVGALDARTVGDEAARIDAVVQSKAARVVVDLSELQLLDSAGVHALVDLHKRVTAQGGTVVVIGVHDQPLAVLELLKLDAVFGC